MRTAFSVSTFHACLPSVLQDDDVQIILACVLERIAENHPVAEKLRDADFELREQLARDNLPYVDPPRTEPAELDALHVFSEYRQVAGVPV